jgi:hypothetical protein
VASGHVETRDQLAAEVGGASHPMNPANRNRSGPTADSFLWRTTKRFMRSGLIKLTDAAGNAWMGGKMRGEECGGTGAVPSGRSVDIRGWQTTKGDRLPHQARVPLPRDECCAG